MIFVVLAGPFLSCAFFSNMILPDSASMTTDARAESPGDGAAYAAVDIIIARHRVAAKILVFIKNRLHFL